MARTPGMKVGHRPFKATLLWLFLAVMTSIWAASCSVDLNEELIPCKEAHTVETAHSWGKTIAVTPADDYRWSDLLLDPFRAYGLPPVTAEELRTRHGPPSSQEKEKYLEYHLPTGRLWLRLEQDASGSAVHEAWRLRFAPKGEVSLSDVINQETLRCIHKLLRDEFDLVVLDRESRVPRVSLSVHQEQVGLLTWTNLEANRRQRPALNDE